MSLGKLQLQSALACCKLVVCGKPCSIAQNALGEVAVILGKFLLVAVHGLLIGLWLLISGALLLVERSRVDVGRPHHRL